MRAQHLAARARPETGHDPRPERTCRTQLRHFHEEVHADAEKEAEPPGERIHFQPAIECRTNVRPAVGEGEGQLLHRRPPGPVPMIPEIGSAACRGSVGRYVYKYVVAVSLPNTNRMSEQRSTALL